MSGTIQPTVVCRWDGGWAGKCKSIATRDGFCEKHHGKKCVSCGSEAVRECDHTGIQFVCGAPLCATCQHGIPKRGEPGMFLLGGGHVTAEVYQEQLGRSTV